MRMSPGNNSSGIPVLGGRVSKINKLFLINTDQSESFTAYYWDCYYRIMETEEFSYWFSVQTWNSVQMFRCNRYSWDCGAGCVPPGSGSPRCPALALTAQLPLASPKDVAPPASLQLTRLPSDLLVLEMRPWRWKLQFIPVPTIRNREDGAEWHSAICFLPGCGASARFRLNGSVNKLCFYDGIVSTRVQPTVLTLSFLLKGC